MLLLSHYWRDYKQLKPRSEFGIYHRTDRIQLGTIIMDDPPGDTKSMDDMVFDEINHIRGFDFNQWYSFCPL